MVQEFEGATEREAIDRAIEELNLDREEFDVEIVEEGKKGFFRKGSVRIKVYVSGRDIPNTMEDPPQPRYNTVEAPAEMPEISDSHPLEATEAEEKTIQFLTETIKRMGYPATISILKKEDRKVVLGIHSQNSGVLIGRKGKNLDALQLLANVYMGRLSANTKVIVDAENYRVRREENLVRLAGRTAEQVRKSRGSRLLEPMNPFERRLIHTTLNDMRDIDTKSEGDGLYKQVRVYYRGT